MSRQGEVHCVKCGVTIARTDNRRRLDDRTMPKSPAVLERPARQAPRLRCGCGHVTILLKGIL